MDDHECVVMFYVTWYNQGIRNEGEIVFKNDDKASKWAFASYVIILSIHLLVFVIAMRTLGSAGETGGWGGLFAAIFGMFFLVAGGLVVGMIGLAFIFFLLNMRSHHPHSFWYKLSNVLTFMIVFIVFIYALVLMVGSLRQESSAITILAIPILLSSAYLLYYTVRKRKV
jgi:hypothetical protein